ncbi:hypothetical protein [Clostridium akagii]|uniref:hypothetical protein n=1 Tax=Clostridium akagii TaxID=91623 RepID=UPI000AF17C85|nr:hypothetical protein [Clostridium akagii]
MSVIIMSNKIHIFGVIERINIGSLELGFIAFVLMLFTIDVESITIKDKDKREYFN